ncbi:hypothetical protein ACIQ7Q_05710 [Streptomyces sp. NPDC096176]|uniref:hypothetical protein n=1 Tax=Streptomyces sp. NPDC096176 TaxID=3366079 RepID=UPI003829D124
MSTTLLGGVAAVTLALGGTLATASSAAAVGSSACTKNVADQTWYTTSLSDGPRVLQSGPGAAYKDKTQLWGGAPFRVYCKTTNKYGNTWYYGKALDAGMTGWLYSKAFD